MQYKCWLSIYTFDMTHWMFWFLVYLSCLQQNGLNIGLSNHDALSLCLRCYIDEILVSGTKRNIKIWFGLQPAFLPLWNNDGTSGRTLYSLTQILNTLYNTWSCKNLLSFPACVICAGCSESIFSQRTLSLLHIWAFFCDIMLCHNWW